VRQFDPANAERLSAAEVAAFDAAVKTLFEEKCRGYGTGVDFGDVVRGVLDLVRVHRVRVGANYATLVINALCLDGMANDLLPGYSVLDGARPLLSAHRRFVCGAALEAGRRVGGSSDLGPQVRGRARHAEAGAPGAVSRTLRVPAPRAALRMAVEGRARLRAAARADVI